MSIDQALATGLTLNRNLEQLLATMLKSVHRRLAERGPVAEQLIDA